MTEITEKQEIAIVALVSGKTRAKAAKLAGVTETTLYKWLSEPKFAGRLQETRRTVYQDSLESLKDAATDAVQTLRLVCNDGEATPAARVSAASAILSQCHKQIELTETNRTVESLRLELDEILKGNRYETNNSTTTNGNSESKGWHN